PAEVAGIESMVGLFINTVPLRLRLPAGKPLLELLTELQDNQSQLIAHQQQVGLADIQNAIGLGELFDTLYVFENYPVDRDGLVAEVDRLRVTAGSKREDSTHYPVSLAAIPGEGLRLQVAYRPELFERSAIEGMLSRLMRVLDATITQIERPIGRLDVFAPTERQLLLREWNATARSVPAATLTDLFAVQALRRPDAVAVVYEAETLTYGTLDARSNQLTRHLRSRGVGPETIVGLCVERTPEMVVRLL